METLIFIGLMMGLVYFMILRPQQRRTQKHHALLRSLKVGDMVVTNAGIHGAVALVDDDEKVVWVEVAPEVELKVARAAIAEKIGSSEDDDEEYADHDDCEADGIDDHDDAGLDPDDDPFIR